MTTLRLLSWNLHAVVTAPRIAERVTLAAEEMLRRRPAVVLLQEVWRKSEAVILEEKFEAKGYRTLLTPEPGGLTRTAGLHAFVDGAAGWRFTDDGFEAFEQSAPAWKFWEGDGLGNKGVQWFRVEGHGCAAWLLNTHLQAAYEPGGYAEIRRAQLRQLNARAAALLEREPLPVIAAGDLNTRPEEPGYEDIGLAWQDLTRGLRDECGCGTLPGAEDEGWLDYVLARTADDTPLAARLELIVNRAKDDPFSDHDGLQADVELPPWPRQATLPLAALAAARLALPADRRSWLQALALLGVGALTGASAPAAPRGPRPPAGAAPSARGRAG